jgi:hypothetical protein
MFDVAVTWMTVETYMTGCEFLHVNTLDCTTPTCFQTIAKHDRRTDQILKRSRGVATTCIPMRRSSKAILRALPLPPIANAVATTNVVHATTTAKRTKVFALALFFSGSLAYYLDFAYNCT